MNIPLSIVLPTKDRLTLLKCTLECILPQLGEKDEILVLVDGPEDQSYEYLQSLAHRNVSLLHPKERIGGFSHYRLLFGAAKHECIVMVHDDELYHGNLLNHVREAFASDSELTFINTGQLVVWAGRNLIIQKNIFFPEEKKTDGKAWASREIGQGMRFNCSCLVFRRDQESLEVLTRTQISADNLFVALLAIKGTVLELPIFGSTWLLHSGNTSRRDYLKIGHAALWQAFDGLRTSGVLGFLQSDSIDAQRKKAVQIYARNAVAAAAVDGNKEGYKECLRQIKLAGGETLLLSVALLPGFWTLFVFLVRLAKRLTPKGRSSQQLGDTDPNDLSSLLNLPDAIVDSWKAIGQNAGR
jgi:glycosyltransferase involved in cell wall biosynthesis